MQQVLGFPQGYPIIPSYLAFNLQLVLGTHALFSVGAIHQLFRSKNHQEMVALFGEGPTPPSPGPVGEIWEYPHIKVFSFNIVIICTSQFLLHAVVQGAGGNHQ
jgi:hypothetical protein